MVLRGVSILVCLSIVFGGCLGLSSCMIVHVDDAGHLSMELPHLLHAHAGADGADHAAHDLNVKGEHSDLHDLLGHAEHLISASRKVERRKMAAPAGNDGEDADQPLIAFAAPVSMEPSLISLTRQSGQPPGLAARTARTSLRATILLS